MLPRHANASCGSIPPEKIMAGQTTGNDKAEEAKTQ
jgi:hypothetical protein